MRTIVVCLYTFAASILSGQTQLYVTGAGLNNLPGLVNPTTDALSRILSSGGNSVYLAVSAKGTRAYYVDRYNVDVAVVDPETDSRLATIPMPSAPGPITLAPDEAHAYVGLDSFLAVIDTKTNPLIGQIAVGGPAFSLAASKTAPRIYMGSIGVLNIIDTAANALIESVLLPVNLNVVAISPSPDGSRVYLCARDDNAGGGAGYLLTFDLSSSTFTGTVALGRPNPVQSDVTPDGSRLYVSVGDVTGTPSGALIAIDTASGQAVANVHVPGYAGAVAVKPDGTALYMQVNEAAADTIYAFSLPDLQLRRRITGFWGWSQLDGLCNISRCHV
jgi:DNA-binding beta-propeller fold protein YncE